MKNTHPAPRALMLLVAGCLFLTVVGVKLAVIDRFGTDLPYWDQWAKEGEMVGLLLSKTVGFDVLPIGTRFERA
ncbi:MAG: hypothetical protein ABI565_14365 [Vicinamibacteria bacterium]